MNTQTRKPQLTLVEPEPLGDIDGACRWLHGEPKDRSFCGHAVHDSSSYCRHHFIRAHNPPEKVKPSDAVFFGVAPSSELLERNADAVLRRLEGML